MATSSAPRRNEEEKRANTYYHERNRTFSSTTTNHYKNKLAQIGIQKDLREILERKKLEKEYEKNHSTAPGIKSNDTSQDSRKVRFVEEKIPIRRSHSFTSGTLKNLDENFVENIEQVKEKNASKKFNRSFRGKRKEFIDLQNPTNIKIEVQTDSGQRKYIVDENVPLANVKCNMKACRNILNHTEKTTVLQINSVEKNREKPGQGSYRNEEKNKPFDKKGSKPAREPKGERGKNYSKVSE